ncbi:MAG: hypothetical protein AAGE76_05595 [Pseudomonadota bacterium]
MLKTCFVHVGHPKTGSSSIEASFGKNRKLLGRAGLLFPKPGSDHFMVGAALRENPKPLRAYRWVPGRAEAFHADLEATLKGLEHQINTSEAQDLLLASESFFSLSSQLTDVVRMRDYLQRFAERVVFIAYVRHPAMYVASSLQQSVKMGRCRLEQFGRHIKLAAQIPQRLEVFRQALGEDGLVVRPFERAQLAHGDVVRDLLELIGYGHLAPDPFEVVQTNESLSLEAVHLADALNKAITAKTGKSPRASRVPQLTIFLQHIRGKKFAVPPKARQRIEKRCAPVEAQLRDMFGIAFHAGLPPEMSGAAEPDWTEQTLADIMLGVCGLIEENQALSLALEQSKAREKT